MHRLLAALALSAVLAGPGGAADAPVIVPMATGNVAGEYFPVGVALCRLVNQDRRTHGLRCAARPSEGSVANIAALRDGSVDLAIVQSDIQDAALTGTGPFAEAGPFADLRAVLALYPEPLTLVAGPDADIAAVGDLVGKRVGLGSPGSGTRAVMDRVIAALGWDEASFAEVSGLGPDMLAGALCSGIIDAFAYVIGQPALPVQDATLSCGARLVPVDGPAIEALVAETPFYFATAIPARLYRGQPQPVPTFGVGATLVTRAEVDAGVIETITGTILDELPVLVGLDPSLVDLQAQQMVRRGLTAPLHPGAAAAMRARGLIE